MIEESLLTWYDFPMAHAFWSTELQFGYVSEINTLSLDTLSIPKL